MKIVTLHKCPIYDKSYFNRDVGQIGYTFLKEKGYKTEVWAIKGNIKQEKIKIKEQKCILYANEFQLYKRLYGGLLDTY